MQVSIIVSLGTNYSKFLDESLNSILKSLGKIHGEILVGIDNSKEAFDFVKSKTYDDRIKFFFFPNKCGTYIIRNSLSTIASSNNLIFFDADDVMMESFISNCLEKLKTYHLVRVKGLFFQDGEDYNLNLTTRTSYLTEGVFCVNRDSFLAVNGFEPWKCAADTEIMMRLGKLNSATGKAIGRVDGWSFHYRRHKTSLTGSRETGMATKLRGAYVKLMSLKGNHFKIDKLVVEKFIPISEVETIDETKISDVLLDERNPRIAELMK